MPAYFLNLCGVQILARNQPHYCRGTNFTHYLTNSSRQSLLSHNMPLSFIGRRGKMSPIYKLINDISIQWTCQYYFTIMRSLWGRYWGALVWNCAPGGLVPAWFFQPVNNPDGQSCWGCALPFPQGTSKFGRPLIQVPFLTWRFLLAWLHLHRPFPSHTSATAQRSTNQLHLEIPHPGLKTDDEAVSVVASER